MAGKRNYPAQQHPSVEPGELTEKIRFMEALADWTFTNDPEKVAFRVKWYFDQCAKYDVRPTVASLAVALNTSRQTMWQWEQKGGELGQIISQAKRILNALLEDWGLNGKVNPVTLVWLQKNHHSYRDTVTVEPMPRQDSLFPTMTPEQIDQYLQELDKRIPNYKLEADPEYQRRIAADIPLPEEE